MKEYTRPFFEIALKTKEYSRSFFETPPKTAEPPTQTPSTQKEPTQTERVLESNFFIPQTVRGAIGNRLLFE